MSKAIKIGINFLTDFSDTVTKLRVNELGASTTNWVPEDEVQADALHVTANGEYSAATAGKYCYDYVTVSVPGNVVTGKDPTTGKEMSVTKDPDTGELDWAVLPVEIRVTTPPTLVQYTDGDTIDFTGLVVHAYDSDGDDLGAVPFGELVFPVTAADYDPYSIYADYSGDTSGWPCPDIKQVPVGKVVKVVYDAYDAHYNALISSTSDIYIVLFHYPDSPEYVGAEIFSTIPNAPYTVDYTVYYESGEQDTWTIHGTCSYHDTTFNSTDYYKDGTAFATFVSAQIGITDIPLSNEGIRQVATILFDGEVASYQTIPVQWPRPADGAVLESSFNIYVTPA